MFFASFLLVLSPGIIFCIFRPILIEICSYEVFLAQMYILKAIFVTFPTKIFKFFWYHFIFFSMNDMIEEAFLR